MTPIPAESAATGQLIVGPVRVWVWMGNTFVIDGGRQCRR